MALVFDFIEFLFWIFLIVMTIVSIVKLGWFRTLAIWGAVISIKSLAQEGMFFSGQTFLAIAFIAGAIIFRSKE